MTTENYQLIAGDALIKTIDETGKTVTLDVDLSGGVESVLFTPQGSTPAGITEGGMYYSDPEKGWQLVTHITGTMLTVNREIVAYVYNNTGAQINNGQTVYINGAFSSRPTVGLAKADRKDTSRLIGMATHHIPNGTYGFITVRGIVNDINTTGLTAGAVAYLSGATAGAMTATRPLGENYACEIGEVLEVHASTGKIYVSPNIAELAVEMTRHKGWPANNKDEVTPTFVDGTRTYSLVPVAGHYHFYQEAEKYDKSGTESLVITNVDGNHFIYYDEGTLTEMVNPTFNDILDLILNKVFCNIIYWNVAEQKAILFAEERHKTQTTDGFTPADHLYKHIHNGALYKSGYDPVDYIVDGNGSLNSHAQIGTGAGSQDDEDIVNISSAVASTTGHRFYYMEGATGVWNYDDNAGFPFPVGATPLPQYNQWTGATWQLAECPTGDFMLLFFFGINNVDEDYNTACILGQATYVSKSDATTAGANAIFSLDRTNGPFQEFAPLFTFILECKTSFTNSVNARLVTTADGDDFIDHRSVSPGAVSSGGASPGGTTPGGSSGDLQFNNAGVLSGAGENQWNDSTKVQTITGSLGVTVDVIRTELASTPATPATGTQKIYCKTDGSWYTLDDAGIETELGGGGGNTVQSITYADPVTPVWASGNIAIIGTLTGDITLANSVVDATAGTYIEVRFQQDATGGRTITLGSDYILLNSNNNYSTTPNAVSIFSGTARADGTIEGGWYPADSDLVQGDITQEINNQTGTTYTLLDSDHGKLVTLSNAGAITLTVPTGLRSDFECAIEQEGAGQVTVTASGTTLHSADGNLATRVQYSPAGIRQKATNVFLVTGDLA